MSEELAIVEDYLANCHAWLCALDPATFTSVGVPGAVTKLTRLREAGEALLPRVQDQRYHTDLHTFLTALPVPEQVPPTKADWVDVRVALAPLYEAVALSVKAEGGRVRHLHPTNYLRSLVHVGSGLLVVAAFEWVFTPFTGFVTALSFTVWAWSLEILRRRSERVNAMCMAFFGPIARDHERYRFNSATWYGTALLVLSVVAFGPAGVLGLLALAIGDPMAGLVGRAYGRTRMWGGKSLEGMVAFALSATVVGTLYLFAFHMRMASTFGLLGLAIIAGTVGAVVELLSTRLEDNFTIPVVTAIVMQVVLTVW